jgi:tRNA dimethylallyltransferase
VICGPTTSGKSDLADTFSEIISDTLGEWVTTILVDSVQVYREIPLISNQARARPAELAGVASVAEKWTVACHKEMAQRIISSLPREVPFVLDSGTGMYLNAILLSFSLSPKAPTEVRAEAWKLAADAENPRREARKFELALMGAPERGSIWDAPLHYDTTLLYLRPERWELDRNISARSARIVRQGAEEAERLLESGILPNPSAREAIGVKEMLLHASGDLSAKGAEETIASRTRRLARRQIRWFDKLARSLPQETPVCVLKSPLAYSRSTNDKQF